MASPRTILQTISRSCQSPLDKAIRYFTVLSVLNNLRLTPLQIKLLAFTAIRGNIASWTARQQFMEENKRSSRASIGNTIHILYKRGLLVKEDGKTMVHPDIRLNFNHTLKLGITLTHGN